MLNLAGCSVEDHYRMQDYQILHPAPRSSPLIPAPASSRAVAGGSAVTRAKRWCLAIPISADFARFSPPLRPCPMWRASSRLASS